MEVDWNYNDGVKVLINQINTGLRYATFTRYPISNPETVHIAMRIALKKGLFREAYLTWHEKPPDERTWYNLSKSVQEQC